jgi:hypothetical protein
VPFFLPAYIGILKTTAGKNTLNFSQRRGADIGTGIERLYGRLFK